MYLESCLLKVGTSLNGFLSESLIFCEQKSERDRFAREKEQNAPVAFCLERQEQTTHGHSFVMSDGSESLTVALLRKRGKTVKSVKTYKKYVFSSKSLAFLGAICSNLK